MNKNMVIPLKCQTLHTCLNLLTSLDPTWLMELRTFFFFFFLIRQLKLRLS